MVFVLLFPLGFFYGSAFSLIDHIIGFLCMILGIVGVINKAEVSDTGIVFSILLIKREIPWACVRRIRYGGLYTVVDFYNTQNGLEEGFPTAGLDPRFFKDVLARLGQAEILPENSNRSI